MSKYPEYKNLNLPEINKQILASWEEQQIFSKSISSRNGKTPFVFYEGPPSANGMPGIHHVMARAIKDIFCRYQTLLGKQVKRKAGWDTHGLPIELGVEKALGITKEDIGKKISVEEYNQACRKDVMKYTHLWNELTRQMGYWVDMDHPYITYTNDYIESVWYLLHKLYSGNNAIGENLLYKGYTIQPYSPAAGTGLSSHELNQPGTYKSVKDRTAVAMFKLVENAKAKLGLNNLPDGWNNVYFLAWTTTPWTLPSNTALAVGKEIDYVVVKTYNTYSHKPITVILAKDLLLKHFNEKAKELKLEEYKAGDKLIPFEIINELKGEKLASLSYEQLLPYVKPLQGDAFRVVCGDFVTTSDGTGIVHISPTFGADDFKVAKQNGIIPLLVERDVKTNKAPERDKDGKVPAGVVTVSIPLVDDKGRFVEEIQDPIYGFGGEYVKEAYLTEAEKKAAFEKQKKVLEAHGKIKELKEYLSVDERLILKLQEDDKLFKKETYEHNYPHCWRTDKPVLYYPLDSWFIKTTAAKEQMIALNKTINWKPEATGTGRFGNWLENLQDWNLSRSRYWGIPLPIWRDIYGNEVCVSSKSELKSISGTGKIVFNGYIESKDFEEYYKQLGENNNELMAELEKEISAYYTQKFPDRAAHLETDISLHKRTILSSKTSAIAALPEVIFNRFFEAITDEKIEKLDLHKPYIDAVYFMAKYGDSSQTSLFRRVLKREPDLIDVWFDSGAMPYAQLHYPFENKELIDEKKYYPADFIAEGVDQTRGWFFTLHAIGVMCFGSVAFKAVVSNGLVLDKNGNKMSKRLGNAVDPFATLEKYGADATRWYMITNAQPWDDLKFDIEGIEEVQRKFFGTLYNTYAFLALYANIDGFQYKENEVPIEKRDIMDKWILAQLDILIVQTKKYYDEYDPTNAGREIEDFIDVLSNWYVRLCRRRFWKGEYTEDKIAAYQTLYTCLNTIAQLMSPIAPFFADWLYQNLNKTTARNTEESVHLSYWPTVKPLEDILNSEGGQYTEPMKYARQVSSLVLSIRKKENIRVRQPLGKVRIAVLNDTAKKHINTVKHLILAEVNVKELEFADETNTEIIKSLKLNFKTLGKKCGKYMKELQAYAGEHQKTLIEAIEKAGVYNYKTQDGAEIRLDREDVEIIPVDIPGWKVATYLDITVALDVTLSEQLKHEGIARELINRIQNLRKDRNLEVTDKILLTIQRNNSLDSAIESNFNYICSETLAHTLHLVDSIEPSQGALVEVDEEVSTYINIEKLKKTI